MTPEQVTAITAIAALLREAGTWPIMSFILLLVGLPGAAIVFVTHTQEKRNRASDAANKQLIADGEKKFQEMKMMYDNNIILVKEHQKTMANIEKMAQGLIDLVSLNTAKWTEAVQKIDTNQYCPHHRTTKIKMETVQQ